MLLDENLKDEAFDKVSIVKTVIQAFVLPAGLCAAGALFLWALPSNAQTLNCELADNAAEFQICNDEDLTVLDEALEKAYVKTFIAQPTLPQQQVVTKAHAKWLSKRNACLGDSICLKERYNERLAELTKSNTPSLTAFSPE